MSVRCQIRALSSSTVVPRSFIITGKGTSRVRVANNFWDRAPINDPWSQGVLPSTVNVVWQDSVDVLVSGPTDTNPQLDLNGVWALVRDGAGVPVAGTTPEGAAFNVLEKVEFVRNQYTP